MTNKKTAAILSTVFMITVGGLLLLAKKMTAAPPEEIPIAPLEAEFTYVSAIRQTQYETDSGMSWSQHYIRVEIDVENIGSQAGVCYANAQLACAQGDWFWSNFSGGDKQLEIQPGETATFVSYGLDSPAYGYNCKVRFTGDPGTTPEVTML